MYVVCFCVFLLVSCMQLLQMFGSLLERPRISELFAPNYTLLLSMFNQEVEHCQFILEQHREAVREAERQRD